MQLTRVFTVVKWNLWCNNKSVDSRMATHSSYNLLSSLCHVFVLSFVSCERNITVHRAYALISRLLSLFNKYLLVHSHPRVSHSNLQLVETCEEKNRIFWRVRILDMRGTTMLFSSGNGAVEVLLKSKQQIAALECFLYKFCKPKHSTFNVLV